MRLLDLHLVQVLILDFLSRVQHRLGYEWDVEHQEEEEEEEDHPITQNKVTLRNC